MTSQMPSDDDDDFEPTSRAYVGASKVVQLHGALIEVVSGRKRGVVVRMTGPTFVIGKGKQVDLSLDDRSVSRKHLSLQAQSDGLCLRDLDSSNGTWVGGCRLTEGKLVHDATITLGTTSIAIHVEKESVGLEISARDSFGTAIGTSLAMRHLFVLLERAARSDGAVLFEGESGSGKEVLASALHSQSSRARHPFVAVDCASIPENLIESELFGHERGAFTGAVQMHKGVFEAAHGGTVFLDEIGELPISQQAKLLRVLENHEVRRVGSTKMVPVDVRIVAATNRSLARDVRKKTFREDLFYRLSVLRVPVPPLRDRKQDIPALAQHFLERLRPTAKIPADLVQVLLAHSWPGNVRELRNVIERWVTFELDGSELLFDEKLSSVGERGNSKSQSYANLPYHEAKRRALEELDRTYFPSVLAMAGGVVSKAAELAGVPRPSFHRMLARARGTAESEGD